MMIDEARGSLNEYILIPGIRGSNIYPNNIVKRFWNYKMGAFQMDSKPEV